MCGSHAVRGSGTGSDLVHRWAQMNTDYWQGCALIPERLFRNASTSVRKPLFYQTISPIATRRSNAHPPGNTPRAIPQADRVERRQPRTRRQRPPLPAQCVSAGLSASGRVRTRVVEPLVAPLLPSRRPSLRCGLLGTSGKRGYAMTGRGPTPATAGPSGQAGAPTPVPGTLSLPSPYSHLRPSVPHLCNLWPIRGAGRGAS